MTKAEQVMQKIALTPNRIMSAVTKRIGAYSQKAQGAAEAGLRIVGADLTPEAKRLFTKNLVPGSAEHASARLGLSSMQALLPNPKKVNPIVKKYIGSKLNTAAEATYKGMTESSKVPALRYSDKTGKVLNRVQQQSGLANAFDAINDTITKSRFK